MKLKKAILIMGGLLVGFVIVTCAPVGAEGTNCPLFGEGDVNCDGMLDVTDLNEITEVMQGRTSIYNTDVNGDGYTNIADLGKVVVQAETEYYSNLSSLSVSGGTLPPTICAIDNVFGGILGVAMGFVGLAVFLMFIYGGYKWLTAGTNEENAKQARMTFVYAILGLVLTFGAWFLLLFIRNITGIDVMVFKIPGCA